MYKYHNAIRNKLSMLYFCFILRRISDKKILVLQENRSSHYPHESRFGFGPERLEKIEDHCAETRSDTVAGRGACDSHTHQVSSWFTLDMGFFPWERGRRRFTGGCRALPLQVTRQRLRRCQGKQKFEFDDFYYIFIDARST